MTRSRRYSAGTRAALTAFSHGTCYWPGCTVPLVLAVDGSYRVNLQIAHIHGLNEGSKRHVPSMTEDELNDFANLIYLCKPHHDAVDEDDDTYPVALLRQWKAEREESSLAALQGLRSLATERGLRSAITEAIAERDQAVEEVLLRLERNDAEAAEVLRELRAELAAAQSHRSPIDPDVVGMLARAADKLSTGLNPDTVGALDRAARRLNLDAALLASLAESADKLRTLPSTVQLLAQATREWRTRDAGR